MKRFMALEFPLKNEMMTTVRLVTGGVCSVAGLTLDESEDCKVCVTESLLLLSRRGYTQAKVTFGGGNGLEVLLEGTEKTDAPEERSAEEEISVALLSALVENLDIGGSDGAGRIAFSFGAK